MKIKRHLMWVSLVLAMLFSALPSVVQAQWAYFTNAPNTNTITILGYLGIQNSTVTIPTSINNFLVTGVGNGAPLFHFGYSPFNVIIPNTVTRIGDNAFQGDINLTNFTIPSSVTSIGNYAFNFCYSLTNIVIPNNVTNIGNDAFLNCSRLMTIEFQGDAPSLGSSVFTGDTNNATVYYLPGTTGWTNSFGGLPTALWSYPDYSFTVQNGTITITNYTGSGGDVTIPATINGLPVTSIGSGAFNVNNNLNSVSIPLGVVSIGDYAFYSCGDLTNVSIPISVTSIGDSAFAWCNSLTIILIPNNVTSIGNFAFTDCSSLIGLAIPNSVTNMGIDVFWGCSSLANVTIPTSITTIGSGMFGFAGGAAGLSVCFAGNAPSAAFENAFSFYESAFYYDSTVNLYYLPGTTGWGQTFAGFPINPLLPQAQTSNVSFGIQTNQFGFNINWASGQTIVVEASTNLVNWQAVQTNTLATGTAYFSDPQWTNYHTRFYRIRSP